MQQDNDPYPCRDDALGLASALIDDYRTGRIPVWPSTVGYAHLLAAGLRHLSRTCAAEVDAIVRDAPRTSPLDWNRILSGIGPSTEEGAGPTDHEMREA